MREILVTGLFMLATLVWAAQRPDTMPQGSGGQATYPGAQVPGATQQQPSMPGSAGQTATPSGAQPGPQGEMANAPITEGCLGGSNPNYTVTNSAGTTYKLNIPPGADASQLASHVGESVAVVGTVNNAGSAKSIDVNRIGRGTSKCPASSSSGTQSPPKQ